METNTCNVNHLDSDALLPPRKRLLAGLKRQNSDVHSLAPTSSHSPYNEYNARLNNLLRLHFSDPNISNEDIVEASRRAAIKAAEVAEAARANAERKAAKAAKAMAAAKTALDLVATLSEETTKKEKSQKKSKMKKHVPVEAFYNGNKRDNTNCRTDEELARKLHQVINSSPRILKSSPGVDSKNQKNKKPKISVRTSIHSSAPPYEGNQHSVATSNGNSIVIKDIDTIMVDLNTSKHDRDNEVHKEGSPSPSPSPSPSKNDKSKFENGVNSPPKDKSTESPESTGKKRGRTKQKKLPLSICNFRDQTSPKGEMKSGRNATTNASSMAASGDSLMPVERTQWKCQAFRAPPVCVTQSKVAQS